MTIDAGYAEALQALTERGRFGIRLGLGRTRALLRELGDPQLGIRGALVAGTNGKGSVLALAGAALRVAGIRAGETPKPHLVTYRERMQIGGRRVKVWRARPETDARTDQTDPTNEPGTVTPAAALVTADGVLVLEAVQPEGKRPMAGAAWRAGVRADARVEPA